MARTAQARSGFALVIALSLMAFVLLLILSITSFVAVEQQSANIAKQQLAAKQNALVGLQIAIGELQRRLGPDQRATASADILDSSNNPYTLVWHSDSTKGWNSATNDWSDSGATADFSLPLLSVDPAKLSTLISSGGKFNESALENPVGLMAITKPSDGTLTSLKAERRPLTDMNGATIGNYAWIAQDESLKANLKTEHGGYIVTDAADTIIDKNHDMALPETSRRLSVFPYANTAGVRISGDFPFGAIEPVMNNGELNIDAYFEKIERAEDLGDLITSGLLDPADKSGSRAEQLAPYHNHFTLHSKGVLADSKNGGLRRDLSRGLDDQYFEKLHKVPVFGVDRYGKATANGTSEPIGDQWKFFRDYYNFYRQVDDGLTSDLGNKNIFYGLNDVTSSNPSTRMRYTNEYVNKFINFIYNANQYPDSNTPAYSTEITPTTHSEYKDFDINEDDWHIFSPMLRPVVLRKTIRIGLQTRLITAGDPINSADDELNVGKYALQFKVYPSMVFWNPFNVAIDLDPGDSDNPLAIGRVIKFHTGGNIDVPININGKEHKLNLSLIAPYLTAFSEDGFESESMPKELAPGEILLLGLKDSYFTKIEKKPYQSQPNVIVEALDGDTVYDGLQKKEFSPPSNKRFLRWNSSFNEPAFGSQNDIEDDEIANNLRFHLYPAASTYNVKSENCIIFENTWFNGVKGNVAANIRLPNGRLIRTNIQVSAYDEPPLYLDGTTPIIVKPNPDQRLSNEYWWQGFVVEDSGKHNPAFHLVPNADLIYLDEEVTYPSASAISSGDPYPFYQIDFRARTLEDEDADGYGNPAFPSFANVNFLGSTTLTVQGGAPGDTTGDVKALYIPERLSKSASFDELPPHDSGTGNAFYGESFDAGVSRIIQYDVPRHPIVSIADFKNITIGWYEDAPPRPVGASWPNATINDLSTPYIRSNRSSGNFGDGAGCDTSYFYNNALFDSFFFSGIPSLERDGDDDARGQTFPFGLKFDQTYIDSGKPLANTRLIYYEDPNVGDFRELTSNADLTTADGFEKTAAHLMIDAPFNINSTSPTAWQAILSGFRGQSINGIDQETRTLQDYEGVGSPFVDHFIPAADDESLYTGHRRLTDNQIADLSEALTREIRDRGISNSLGDFLNRDLNGIGENQKMSRIDEAIKATGLNDTQRIANSTTSDEEVTARPDLDDGAHMFAANLAGETGAGLPGYLKQQDIIRPLAPIMTSRGDTFVIRTYGETVDPVTKKVRGKAMCEAIVQRVPDYVEDSIQAWEIPILGSQNEKFGRRLKIVSFSWLNENDA